MMIHAHHLATVPLPHRTRRLTPAGARRGVWLAAQPVASVRNARRHVPPPSRAKFEAGKLRIMALAAQRQGSERKGVLS
jgi:hypothetical protein